ncbi:MAG: polysaccharide deacetylase family protein [Candidatus Sericytochromatia bacterium]|nr:polysaccharide deacetylase family protein [Candidatus Tanganyikabacteria bacterium]
MEVASPNPYHGVPLLLDGRIPTHLATGERELVLTFDDGPHPAASGPILDILARHGVPATFFLVGDNVRRAPDLARRMVALGHEIGNHTDTHVRLREVSDACVEAEIASCQEAVAALVGVRPRLFRPTYGQYDARVLAVCRSEELTPVQWSAMVWDWLAPDAAEAVAWFRLQLAPGAIVLLHDGANTRLDSREATIAMLPGLLEAAREAGYRWVRLGDRLDRLA